MKPGDLVKDSRSGELGLFVGMRTFENRKQPLVSYTCAEVMWLGRNAPNGERVATIQTDLIEVVKENEE
jgi:hypothetical protein